jgi:hypothetical protein
MLSNTRNTDLNYRFCGYSELAELLISKPRPEDITTAKNDGVTLRW